MLFRQKRFWLVLLAPLSVLITSLGHRYPAAVERLYSRGLYPVLAESYGRVFGYLPFSAAQFLIIILPGAAVLYIIREIRRIKKNPETRKRDISRLLANVACAVGAVWFMFAILCGFNYARESFAVAGGFEVKKSSAEELIALCEELVTRANESSDRISRDESGRMEVSAGSDYALAGEAREAYDKAAEEYPVLGGFCTLPKPVLYSRFMSRIDIVGIYIPFTMEANVNVDVCDYEIPSSMAHELAHFKGFMREDEANFIAYLACEASGNPDFMYSGELLALVHATNQLHTVSGSDYDRVMAELSESVRVDFRANSAYWRQFEGPVAEVSSAVNDAYLKTNRQSDGIKSYGRMVDLLLADYRKRHGVA